MWSSQKSAISVPLLESVLSPGPSQGPQGHMRVGTTNQKALILIPSLHLVGGLFSIRLFSTAQYTSGVRPSDVLTGQIPMATYIRWTAVQVFWIQRTDVALPLELLGAFLLDCPLLHLSSPSINVQSHWLLLCSILWEAKDVRRSPAWPSSTQ